VTRVPRRVRVLVGLLGALVLLVVLVVPVVLTNGGGGGSSCKRTLRYAGRDFVPRDASAVQSLAIGAGVVSGCGAAPEDVDVRSLGGISPAVAVALPTESGSVYVARGRCPGRTGTALVRCLRR
jgi:hypothetical protein